VELFSELGVFEYHLSQRERFRTGKLWEHWAEAYPKVFDADDIRIARTQAGPPNNLHFFEWLAAVLIYQSFGYLSLLQQYEFKEHRRKQAVLRELLAPEVFALVTHHKHPKRLPFGDVQCPDLLVYAPDRSDWFFCEVKGPRDRLREVQAAFFHALSDTSGKDIRLVRFRLAPMSGAA
jgi:hypothetical protein